MNLVTGGSGVVSMTSKKKWICKSQAVLPPFLWLVNAKIVENKSEDGKKYNYPHHSPHYHTSVG
jgi:hypothetical protein